MVGIINIHGIIGNVGEEPGVQLIDLITQVQSQLDSESYIIDINSPGGDCDLGYEMYAYLRSIGKPLTSRISGQCMSIATIPYLAGDIRLSGPIMIHNPWISGLSGDSDELLRAAELMREEEDKMIDFYAEHTGNTREALDALMKSETYLTPEQAISLRFSTQAQIKPLAYKENNMSKVLKSIDDLFKKYGFKEPDKEPKKVALDITDATGATYSITMAGNAPAVGDTILDSQGQPFTGKLDIAEAGVTIVAEAGVITEVMPIVDKTSQVTALQTENENLKKEIEGLKTTYATLENDMLEKLAFFDKALSATKSNYTPPQARTIFAKKTEEKEGLTVKAMNERKATYKNNNK